jgi:hypothetical protein
VSAAAPVLGVLAAIVSVADTVPYLRDTVRGTTRPHRGTWLIWGSLAVIVCLSQRADGANWSLALTITQAVLCSAIFVLAIRRGEGGVSAADVVTIAFASGGVAIWLLAAEPLVATVGVIVADLLAVAMMVPKTRRDPDSETLSTFALASVAGALTIGAVGSTDPSLLLFPAYYCLANAGVAVLIALSRRDHGAISSTVPSVATTHSVLPSATSAAGRCEPMSTVPVTWPSAGSRRQTR